MNQALFDVLEADHSEYLSHPIKHHTNPIVLSLSKCESLLEHIYRICGVIPKPAPHEVIESAARVVKNALKSFTNKMIFRKLKRTLKSLRFGDHGVFLKLVDDPLWNIYEKSIWNIDFRFAGQRFPPKIVYKVLFKRTTVNLSGLYGRERWKPVEIYRLSARSVNRGRLRHVAKETVKKPLGQVV
ncbi:hypothetical protein GWI33_012888 [Rhynchophorus ferrugineus]|uniref:Uncharacterized protein n=1 Tax=Rhynchophorus ferrugineus TaxID=354439 RepID=A0A834I9A3_RHYFE|nr:hypothetical protein GWI33_012888 [Rhynchophorus ferrugineus]